MALLPNVFLPNMLMAQPTNGMNATSVLGQPNFTNVSLARQRTLSNPGGIAIDNVNGKVYVADQANNRVLRYSTAQAFQVGGTPEAVFGQADFLQNLENRGGTNPSASTLRNPVALALDLSGNLYVTDFSNNRVLRYNNAATASSGAAANGVFGQANMTSGAENAGGSAGATTMRYPQGVTVDRLGNLYVADGFNARVLRFANAASVGTSGATPTAVFGQSNYTTTNGWFEIYGTAQPVSLAIDGSFNLYVADKLANRVVRFANAHTSGNRPDAATIYGQLAAPTASAPGSPSNNRLYSPYGVAVDGSGNLFVADYAHQRVLRFSSASTATLGAAADRVIGQPNFTTGTANNGGVSASSLINPFQVAVDASGNLYVGEANNRVLVYTTATTALTNNMSAFYVMGQDSFTGNVGNAPFENQLNSPAFVLSDNGSGKVFVVDQGNHRVVRYASAQALLTGGAPEMAFGQTSLSGGLANFFGSPAPPVANSLNAPSAIALDGSGNLYVADNGNSRILRFANAITAFHRSIGECSIWSE
jgi:sugar lactone lactonase YvrE